MVEGPAPDRSVLDEPKWKSAACCTFPRRTTVLAQQGALEERSAREDRKCSSNAAIDEDLQPSSHSGSDE